MSIIRQDPTTKEWVIVATERAKRPDDFKKVKDSRFPPPHDATCPFCPGYEAETPPELLRLLDHKSHEWRVRVIPNKFAALSGRGEAIRREEGLLFREMEGVGFHEVIVETPLHNQMIPFMDTSHVEQILFACQSRYRTLREDPRIKNIMIFKNYGDRAGTSLEHPHCQLVATPVAPLLIRKKYEVAITHYDDTGRCLYCDLLDEERRVNTRLLFETEHFVVFHPFASRLPFETWIVPKRRQSSFGQVEGESLTDLARVLKKTLHTLYTALCDPDYNYIIHSSPTTDESKDYFLWHIQILPRLTTIAGFELGSGIFINTMLPENSAKFLREYCV